MTSDDRIFVQIASYRDTECQWTIRDLFEKAKNPGRVFVGVVWQFVPEEDSDCFLFETRPDQVRSLKFHARDSNGPCWARSKGQQLWNNEDYTLQIDSHMRFEPGWDEKMIELLGQCGSHFPILSTYPPAYTPPDILQPYIPYMFFNQFNDDGIPSFRAYYLAVKDAPPKPMHSAFCAAGFLFGPSKIIREVPYDPHLYFVGEEISMAVRLWTSGWDFFAPNEVVVYHNYKSSGTKYKSHHWHDHQGWAVLDRKAMKRVRHLLGIEPSHDPEALAEIERYGLGSRRTLAEYEAFSGIHFKTREAEEKAKTGKFA